MRLPWGGMWTARQPALVCRGAALVLVALCASCVGCFGGQQRQQQELLEAELRSQERHIQEMKEELDRKEGIIHGLDVEVERCQQAAACPKQPGGDSAPIVNVVRDIALGRLTGGIRENPKAVFDDALLVVLQPRDPEGHVIKAPGSVHIDVFEITPQGLKSPLSSWDITQRELRRLWDEPLIGGPSYRITLTWKALPTTEKLRVVARFTTLDGKLFEAERDITIQLPSGIARPGLPVGIPGYCPPPPVRTPSGAVDEKLAPPKPVEPPPPAAATPKQAEGEIPVIQLPPREFPGTPANEKKAETPGSPPPLPAPPAVPTFEEMKSAEVLPAPRSTPQTSNPIPPGANAAPMQRTGGPTPLTAPPPQSWRERHTVVQVTHTDEPPVRLLRPLRKSAVSDQ
jgi:hypothetical protein